MAKELFRKSTAGTQHTVSNGAPNYERYEYLAKAFSQNDLYRIFARPVILGRDEYDRPSLIRWMTDYDFVGEPVSLLTLPAAEQDTIRGKVKYTVDLLYQDANRYMLMDPAYADISKILDSCIEIPDDGCIQVLKVPDSSGKTIERYVLTQWGFINDDRKIATGIIKRWTGLQTRNLRLRLEYPGGLAAAGQDLHIEVGSASKVLHSDQQGIITLQDIPVSASLHCYQLIDASKQNIHNINTDDREEYVLALSKPVRKGSLTITVKDHKGATVPHLTAYLAYAGRNDQKDTGADGRMIIGDLPENTQIDVSIPSSEGPATRYVVMFNPDRPTETITLPPPKFTAPVGGDKEGPLSMLFVDKKGIALPDIPVAVTYRGKTYNSKTDQAGKVALKALDYQQPIQIRAQSGRASYKGQIMHVPQTGLHTLMLKKSSLWWLWVLIGLLLLWLLIHLLGGLVFTPPVLPPASAQNPQINPDDSMHRDSAAKTPPPVVDGLSVHVIDSATHDDLPRASVQIDYHQLSATTDSAGKYVFTNIARGTTTNAIVALHDFVSDTVQLVSGDENLVRLKPIVKYLNHDSASFQQGLMSIFTWDVGDKTRSFWLGYDMYDLPDQLEIFCGKDTKGKEIYFTHLSGNPNDPAHVKGHDSVRIENTCGSRYVTVRVIADTTLAPDKKHYATSWDYRLFRASER